MIKSKIVIGNDLLGLATAIKAETARRVAVKVKAEFNNLLMTTPQYSGNYVSNMRIDIGDRAVHSQVDRPYKKYPKSPKSKGVLGPITRARNNNNLDTLEARFVAHALGLPVWGARFTVYNNMREAKYIEGMSEDRMRSANKSQGIAAMSKFFMRVQNYNITIKVT